jgi:peptidoglycan L-alanyl-D-glutamate endopeptidase CwlK
MPDDKPAKDYWDKAAIISTFLSSVVIAVVGLTINFSVQEAQRVSAVQNAKAQIEQSKQIADSQRKVQEGVLTAQLVDHLASTSEVRRKIAIVALQNAVPDETYQRVLNAVVTQDPSPEVRIVAIRQAANIFEPGEEVTKSIAAAVQDTSKQQVERDAATIVSDKLEQDRLNSLKPEAAVLARKLIESVRKDGIDVRITVAYRSLEDQQKAYEFAQKIRDPTFAARWSVHNTGLAFDLNIFENGRNVTSTDRIKIVGEIGKKLGLVWGGDTLNEPWHFETKDARDALNELRKKG